jgi:hypothetical protein
MPIVQIGPKGSKLDWDNWGKPITDAVNTLWDTVILGPQVASQLAGSSAISTITAVLTLPSCTFKAGRAYRIEIVGGIFADATGRLGDFGLFKNTTGGTQIGALYRYYAGASGAQTMANGFLYVKNATGADVVMDLLLTLTASAGTVTHDAAATRPRALIVVDVGTATQWAYAFGVT